MTFIIYIQELNNICLFDNVGILFRVLGSFLLFQSSSLQDCANFKRYDLQFW